MIVLIVLACTFRMKGWGTYKYKQHCVVQKIHGNRFSLWEMFLVINFQCIFFTAASFYPGIKFVVCLFFSNCLLARNSRGHSYFARSVFRRRSLSKSSGLFQSPCHPCGHCAWLLLLFLWWTAPPETKKLRCSTPCQSQSSSTQMASCFLHWTRDYRWLDSCLI